MKLQQSLSSALVAVAFVSNSFVCNGLPALTQDHRRAAGSVTDPIDVIVGTFAPQPTDPPFKPTFAPETDPPTFKATDEPTQSPRTNRPSPEPTQAPETDEPTAPPTPSPTPSPTTRAPTTSPTPSPTTTPGWITRRPSVAPTDEPTSRSTDKAATDPPSFLPTESPSTSAQGSKVPSVAPSIAESTVELTTPPSQGSSQTPSSVGTATATSQATASPTVEQSPTNTSSTPMVDTSSPTNMPELTQVSPLEDSIVAEVQSMANSIEFTLQLSLWSPEGIPRAEADFEPISNAVLTSLRMLYCEDPSLSVCVVRDDLLLTSKDTFVSQSKQESSRLKTLVMPTIGKVVAVEEDNFAYTAWEVSIEVLQLGGQYIQDMVVHLQETEDLTNEELLILIPRMIREKVTLDVETAIQEGTFDGLLHGILLDDTIVSSIPGQEEITFGVLIPQPAEKAGEAGETAEVSGSDLTLIAIYVSIAVVIIISAVCLLTIYYYSRIEESSTNSTGKQKETTSVGDESIGGADDKQSNPQTTERVIPTPAMISPSVATESDGEDHSTAMASWQVKPRTFVLQTDSQCQSDSESDHPDDGTDFPTAGSIVAGSVMMGSMMAESVESSLDGWSVHHGSDINWA